MFFKEFPPCGDIYNIYVNINYLKLLTQDVLKYNINFNGIIKYNVLRNIYSHINGTLNKQAKFAKKQNLIHSYTYVYSLPIFGLSILEDIFTSRYRCK